MTIQNNFTRHFGKFATHPLTRSGVDLAAASIAPSTQQPTQQQQQKTQP
jgi:hypothetical protein